MAENKMRDEMDDLLVEIEKLKGVVGKDWSIEQARKMGLSEEEIAKLFTAK